MTQGQISVTDPYSISLSSLNPDISVWMVQDDESYIFRRGLSDIVCIEHLVLIPLKKHVRLSVCNVSSPEIILPGRSLLSIYSFVRQIVFPVFFSKILSMLPQFSQEKCLSIAAFGKGQKNQSILCNEHLVLPYGNSRFCSA